MKDRTWNRSQSKYEHTARLMDEALISLLEKKNYEFITVKEICEKAGVNRSTFYLHYETMEDVLAECIAYIGKKVVHQFQKSQVIDKSRIATCPLEELLLVTPQYLLPYLQFVKENKAVFLVAASQPSVLKTKEIAKQLYDDLIQPILARFQIPEKERPYRLAFYLNGIGSVMMEWVKGGCQDDMEDIAHIVMECLNIHA